MSRQPIVALGLAIVAVGTASGAETVLTPSAFLADRIAPADGRAPIVSIGNPTGDVRRIVLRGFERIMLASQAGRIDYVPIGADGTVTLRPPTPEALAGRHVKVVVRAGGRTAARMVTFPDRAGTPATLELGGFPPHEEPTPVVAFVSLPPPKRMKTPGMVLPPGARMRLAIAAVDDLAGTSGPARFRVLARGANRRTVVLLDRTLDPEHRPADRGWVDVEVPLDRARGDTDARVRFAFEAAGLDAERPTMPYWADPVVVSPRDEPAPWSVLLVSLDTLRADRLGVYGARRETSPALDRFAAEGTLLETAIAPAPWTLPSHATMLTGLYACVHGLVAFVPGRPLPGKIVPLAEHLRRLGWETAAFTEDGFFDPAAFDRGFGYYRQNGSRDPDRVRTTFGWVSEWLRRPPARPFFAFVHTYQTHLPYWAPDRITTLFAKLPGLVSPLEPREAPRIERDLARYDAAVRYTDETLGELLATLDASGLGARTLVVITSDHGEAFGEHGYRGHGATLHEEVLHVPFVVRAPGLVAAGRRLGGVASLADIAPTILDLIGAPPLEAVQGVSLADRMRADRTPSWPAPRVVFSESSYPPSRRWGAPGPKPTIGPYRLGVRGDAWKFVFSPERAEAYDLARDPSERRPVNAPPAVVAQAKTVRERFEADCARLRAELGIDGPEAPVAAPDPVTTERLRALGYIE
ncbi:MAG TPA: sulfatase [Candidatus Binatia bacterium]|nr:sulfatase [Candidatus Binatia bacterium]